MSQVLDYSSARPGGARIRADGYTGVMRYLSYDEEKNLSPAERDDLHANGLDIGLVWETTADRALSGHGGGVSDAQVALAQARALGLPDACPIYFAVDFDTTPEQQAAIDAYLVGAGTVIGAHRVGVYGSYYVVERCAASGSASWFWQTLAWSGGQQSDHNDLYQNGQQLYNGGADVNDVRGDWGPWKAGSSPQPQPGPEVVDPRGFWWFPYVDLEGQSADQVVELNSVCHADVFTAGGSWYRGNDRIAAAVLGEYAEWVLANRVNGVWYVMDESGGPQGMGPNGRLAPEQAYWLEDAVSDSTGCGGTNPPQVALSGKGRWYAPVIPPDQPAPEPTPPDPVPPEPEPEPTPEPEPEPTPPTASDPVAAKAALVALHEAFLAGAVAVADLVKALGL